MMSENILNHNKSIMSTKYFSVKDAIAAPIKSNKAFIIANERKTRDNSIGRFYTVFPSINEFLNNRENYPNCHELLVDHIRAKSNFGGRLVFDFDLKNDGQHYMIPDNFKDQIEDIIIDVVERFFHGVDTNKFEFVWSTSQSPYKFSKHLTVKHLYFDEWIKMSKVFYRLFCTIWDDTHKWIPSGKLIDFQIVRNNGSLRMVGSSKLGGYLLVFDDKQYTLKDSLIRIYTDDDLAMEQLVTKDDINQHVFKDVLTNYVDFVDIGGKCKNHICIGEPKMVAPIYDLAVYNKAFEIYEKINPGVFKMGKISGDRVSFIRIKPFKCLLSGRVHENENAYCQILRADDFYTVHFGCYRKCYSEPTVKIGSISTGSHLVFVDPNFEGLYCGKKKRTLDIKFN